MHLLKLFLICNISSSYSFIVFTFHLSACIYLTVIVVGFNAILLVFHFFSQVNCLSLISCLPFISVNISFSPYGIFFPSPNYFYFTYFSVSPCKFSMLCFDSLAFICSFSNFHPNSFYLCLNKSSPLFGIFME